MKCTSVRFKEYRRRRILGSGLTVALVGTSGAMTHLACAVGCGSCNSACSSFAGPLQQPRHTRGFIATALAARAPSRSKGAAPGQSSWETSAAFLLRLSNGEVGADELQRALQAGKLAQGRRGWEWALALIGGVRASGAQLDASMINIAIETCGKASRWEPALKLLHDLRRAGKVPNAGAFDAVVRACDRGIQWEWSLELLREMTELEHEPNASVYGDVISACERAGKSIRALKLLNEMCERSLEPEVVTFSVAVGACKKKLVELVGAVQSKETKRFGPSKPRPTPRKTLVL